jgi:hypothetical protein
MGYDPERLSYWDTGWTGDFVMRMNNKINKDLPPEYRIQILITVIITGWINQVLRDIKVPNSRTTLITTRVRRLFMDPAVSSLISQGILKLESEKLTGVLQSPPKRSRLVEKVSWNPKRDRDKNGKTYSVTVMTGRIYCATTSSRLSPNFQPNREPGDTEEDN